MMQLSASLPADETERLRALRASGLLEDGADPALDAIVRLAAAAFNAPIAAVTLLDDTRQKFKASVGLGVPHTPRELAFCNHTILDSAPLVVLDASGDRRFAANPLVIRSPHVRFYAGVAVCDAAGHRLGALCTIDTVARDMPGPELLSALCTLAADVSRRFARPRYGAG